MLFIVLVIYDLTFETHVDLAFNLQVIEQQKKNFVRGSKSFSDTLKRYFKDGRSVSLLLVLGGVHVCFVLIPH